MTTLEFIQWVTDEMKARGWKPADLARESEISPSQITRMLNHGRGVGQKSLAALAKAFKLPVEYVYEKARFIPEKNDLSPIKRKLLHVAESEELQDSDIELAITILEQRIESNKKSTRVRTAQQ